MFAVDTGISPIHAPELGPKPKTTSQPSSPEVSPLPIPSGTEDLTVSDTAWLKNTLSH